jgi:Tol biopolymer transport system component
MKHYPLIAILLLIFLSACTAVPTGTPLEFTEIPNVTPIPTHTPTPTSTPITYTLIGEDLIAFGIYGYTSEPYSVTTTYYLVRPDGSGLVSIFAEPVDTWEKTAYSGQQPLWSPDGTRLLLVQLSVTEEGLRSTLVVFDLLTGNTTLLAAEDEWIFPGWSPDGNEVFYTVSSNESSRSYLTKADGSSTPKRILAAPGNPLPFGMLSDGNFLVISLQESEKEMLQLMTFYGARLVNLTPEMEGIFYPRLSPAQDFIVFITYETANLFRTYSLYSVSLDGEGLTKIIELPDREISNFAISPDGERITFQHCPILNEEMWLGQCDVSIVDISSGEVTPISEDENSALFPTWSPDGKYILYLYTDPETEVSVLHKVRLVPLIHSTIQVDLLNVGAPAWGGQK